MIEGLSVPNPFLPAQSLIDFVGRSAFDGIHDFGKRTYLWRVWIRQRGEDHVDVIGHNDRCLKIEFCSLIVQAAIQDYGSGLRWQNPAMIGAEGQEVSLVVTLQMRQLAAIEGLEHE